MRAIITLLSTVALLVSLLTLPCLPSRADELSLPATTLYLPLVCRQLPGPALLEVVSPKDGAQIATLAPELVWRSMKDHWFSIQISTDSQFSTVIQSVPARTHSGGPEYSTSLLSNLQMTTRYYWRVGYEDETGAYTWSQAGWFSTPGPGRATPPAPHPAAPSDGSTVNCLYPYLGWQGVTDARMYHLTLGVYENMFTFSVLSPGASQVIPFELLPGRTYAWHVRAFNGFAWGPESETWLFRTPSP